MKKYETIFILNPEITEEEVNSVVDKVKSLIEKSYGIVEKVDFWAKKRLAYKINKRSDGYFTLINFSSKEDFPKELDRNFRIMDLVIRHIIVKKD